MAETITLEIPEILARRARQVAARSQRRVEDVLIEWIGRAASEPSLEQLSDEELLSQCDVEMSFEEQQELQELLSQKREGSIDASRHARLEQLMAIYRRGLLLKARATKAAVERGLTPPLS